MQWTFRFDDDMPEGQSEGAPAVAQLDDDPALEVVLGTDANQPGVRARVYVLDGATGERDATPFVGDDRTVADAQCPPADKIDSSSPAIVTVDGEPRLFVGAWDGTFRALAVRDGALVPAWTDALPTFGFECSIAKVRPGAVVGDLLDDPGLEVAFGMMGEGDAGDDFTASSVRILAASTGELRGELTQNDWKSSPAAADVTGDGVAEIFGGRFRGYYGADWSVDWGDGNPYGANRSSPALGDIDGDGALEILYLGTDGVVYALDSYCG